MRPEDRRATAGCREKGGAVLSDLVVGDLLRSEMIDKRLFDLGGVSVLHGDESSREHESGLVGGVQLAAAVARPDDPRRSLAGRSTRGQREREVDEATGFTSGGGCSYLVGKAMQDATVAVDEGLDEAASQQSECFPFFTREQEVSERILDVIRIDEEGGGASMESLLSLRVVRVEAVPKQVSEQMVVSVSVSGELDEEEVPVVDAAKQSVGVAASGHGCAALRVEHVEDRGREQELEDLSGLAFEYLCSEEVCDRAWRFRELGEEAIGDRFVAKRQRSHLDASGPPLSAVHE